MKDPTEEVRRICFDTLVVGYFAYAQYDVKAQVGYFACAQYDVKAQVGYFANAQYDMRGFIRYCATFLYCHCCGAVRLDLNQSVRYSGVSEAEKYIFVFPSFFAE